MWVDRLRTALALTLGPVLTLAMFGALLGLMWLPIPAGAGGWRTAAVLLAAGIAVLVGGMAVAWIAARQPLLHAGIFGVGLSTMGSMVVLGPTIVIPVIGVAFGGTAIVGAAVIRRRIQAGAQGAQP